MKLVLVFAMVLLQGCAISPKFSGPLYDGESKRLTVPPDKVMILALTNGRLIRSKRTVFDDRSKEIYEKLDQYPGYAGGTVKIQLFGDEVWTMTVWQDRESLDNFRKSSQHTEAKIDGKSALKGFRHLNKEVLAKDLPYTWDQAEELLEGQEFGTGPRDYSSGS